MNEERLCKSTCHQAKTPLNLVGSIHSQSLSRNSSIHNWPERNSNFVCLSDAFPKGQVRRFARNDGREDCQN
jgi:hypothetical protein